MGMDTPVWRCTDDLCEEVWAQDATPTHCPSCGDFMKTPVEAAGFTVGEAIAAESLYNVDVDVYIPVIIPFKLVKLSTLPEDTWVGRPVFHPHEQAGDKANWHRYDVGIVTEVYPDRDFRGVKQCRFVHGILNTGNGTLHYGPDNLWVPDVD